LPLLALGCILLLESRAGNARVFFRIEPGSKL
jgi:hypothetical protein